MLGSCQVCERCLPLVHRSDAKQELHVELNGADNGLRKIMSVVEIVERSDSGRGMVEKLVGSIFNCTRGEKKSVVI